MALYIGAYLPDRQLDESPFHKALVRVAAGLAQQRTDPLQTRAPNLDLHFLMPGREEAPPFDGMRFHSFDSRSNTLRIESSVPSRMIGSSHAEAFVIAAMQDAVDNAREFFDSRSTEFSSDEYFALIDRIGGIQPINRILN
ncbi:hypothetical protein GCM10011352_19020 [Marinobacterium zhoushanense]|uniref:Immunity protein 8 of polymorphic toxin system n=1 Tax=Marinobacterium zhoushanense TaxID=1679163 RepID=A0ABQ1KDE4_9GAMM|nr:hypothetical protein [Marinobacterium zhoushanense]GGB93156.1 hypothetical protein GCM10011352_19020 [Marinobacterium zhoushanense]